MAQRNLRAAEPFQEPRSEALLGLDGVLVLVDLPSEAAAVVGLEKAAISDGVDRQLRAAGIRNLSREESVRQGAAELRVSIRGSHVAERALDAYSVEVTVREPVLLVRDQTRSIVAVTWQSPGVVMAGTSPPADSIARQIESEVDCFVRCFREANKIR